MRRLSILVALSLSFGCDDGGGGVTMIVGPSPDMGGPVVDAFRPGVDLGPPIADAMPMADEDMAMAVDAGVDATPLPDPDRGLPPPPEGVVASIIITEQPQVPAAAIDVAVVAFMEPPPIEGDCQVVAVDPNAQPQPAQMFDAGAITVEGVRGGPFTYNLSGGAYRSDGAPGDDLFGDGATVRAVGAGGVIPAFDIELPVPGEVTISSPSQLSTASANEDLPVRWNAGDADVVLVTVFPLAPFSVDPVAGDWIFCGVGDSGNFTLRAADLERTARGGGPFGQGVLIAVTRTHTVTEPVGDGLVTLTATTSFGVTVTLE